MKIKITQAGWAGYTGDLGPIAFLDGVSVDDVGSADAAYLAGIVAIENVDTGKNPSVAQRIVDSYDNSAKVEVVVVPAPVAPVGAYTKEQLETIADASGIKGIREVAEPMGLKGNAISELIEKILAAQVAAAEAAAVAVAEAAAAVVAE